MRITITIEDGEDVTSIQQESELLTWMDAHRVFFRALRGAGYPINGEDYIGEVSDSVKELVEAERTSYKGLGEELNVGGGGFLSE